MGLPPSVNVTVPVALAGITFAVKVTGFPLAAGLGEANNPVIVGIRVGGFTTSLTVGDVLVWKALSPL
jgi:hypothetical protein